MILFRCWLPFSTSCITVSFSSTRGFVNFFLIGMLLFCQENCFHMPRSLNGCPMEMVIEFPDELSHVIYFSSITLFALSFSSLSPFFLLSLGCMQMGSIWPVIHRTLAEENFPLLWIMIYICGSSRSAVQLSWKIPSKKSAHLKLILGRCTV